MFHIAGKGRASVFSVGKTAPIASFRLLVMRPFFHSAAIVAVVDDEPTVSFRRRCAFSFTLVNSAPAGSCALFNVCAH